MPIPQTMSYIQANGAGGPELLGLATGAVPVPRPDEVLIRVQAAGVNRPDGPRLPHGVFVCADHCPSLRVTADTM